MYIWSEDDLHFSLPNIFGLALLFWNRSSFSVPFWCGGVFEEKNTETLLVRQKILRMKQSMLGAGGAGKGMLTLIYLSA